MKKRIFPFQSKHSIYILLIAAYQCTMLRAGDNDTIYISDTMDIGMYNPEHAVYYNALNCYFMTNRYEPDNQINNKSIFKLDEDDSLSYFVTDTSTFSVRLLTILNDVVYTTDDDGVIKGFDCFTGEKAFENHPWHAAMELWGICNDGDSLLFVVDGEFDLIYKINVNDSSVTIIETAKDYFSLGSICYDSKNKRLLVLYNDKGKILSVDLENEYAVSVIDVDFAFRFNSIEIDKAGNIYLACYDVGGIYKLIPGEVNQLKRITQQPAFPGLLSYDEEQDILLIPDRNSSLLYRVQLANPTGIKKPGLNDNNDPHDLTIYPNPIKEYTNISLRLQSHADVHIEIYNTQGQIIQTLFNNKMYEGVNTITWNRLDNSGNRVIQGCYFIVVYINNEQPFAKTLILE